ncbi:protein of unknown function [Tepidibacter aestuarii]|nr:protein of unknown function [Tepidibacter aestuarii]
MSFTLYIILSKFQKINIVFQKIKLSFYIFSFYKKDFCGI